MPLSGRGDLPIEAYGLIGDGRTAALVGSDGSVDWWCRPRFDSTAVFCRLLDAARGGTTRLGPVGRAVSQRRYVGPSGVLETTFEAASGSVRITDLLVAPEVVLGGAGSRLLRLVEGVAGHVELELRFRPTFDFARTETVTDPCAGGAIAVVGADALAVTGPMAFEAEPDGGVRGTREVVAGDRFWVLIGDPEGGRPPSRLLRDADADLERTLASHRRWTATGSYDGPHAPAVERSAMTLRLLTHTPTGAPVAAPTTSLPEDPGGVRNWDYRFTWLRDAALGLTSLQRLGHHDEAMAFWSWLADRSAAAGPEGMQISYRVDGAPVPPEEELGHLSGYGGARPVRVGNAAAAQRQHDVSGEVLDASWYCRQHMPGVEHPYSSLARLADATSRTWRAPDRGIWELRSAPRHLLHSKLYAWVALDRAVRLAHSGALSGDAAGWSLERDRLAHAILSQGSDPTTGVFTSAFGSTEIDASVLAVPLVGFLPADDPRVIATVAAVRAHLEEDGLLYRYRRDDGLPGTEGAFLPCTFWLAEVLALQGAWDEAHAVFEQAAGCANDLGLLAEEVEPGSGRLLGNFPQAFSHLALVRAALRLSGR